MFETTALAPIADGVARVRHLNDKKRLDHWRKA
jgi:hypothetical protein